MTIVFESNHFNTIIKTKYGWVPCYVQNKPSLNNFMRESSKIAKKKHCKFFLVKTLKSAKKIYCEKKKIKQTRFWLKQTKF